MALRIFNTLSRRKEDFVAVVPGEVRLYVCGVTVYDLCHIGHARSAIAFDIIRRYLRYRGYAVTFVKNYTDVDDKIIQRANEEGVTASVVSERYIAEYQTDMASIGVAPADVEPKATDHIPQMVTLIQRLIARGVAYPLEGDVYFEVRRFPSYGKLSGKNLDELEAGARVDVNERKRDPGWHIECSAMAMQYLGETFDLHGGGEDLIFPHHENEIAQSEGATGKPFVRCWAHNGFVNLDAEKMSKSVGNTLLIRDMVRRHDPEALRLYFLGTHYRHPLEYADERIAESGKALGRLRALVEEAELVARGGPQPPGTGDAALLDRVDAQVERFTTVMDDDFNTPQALAVLFDLLRVLYGSREQGAGAGAFVAGAGRLVELARVLGLLEQGARAKAPIDPQLKARVESLVYLREQARKQRDFAEADRLRQELVGLNVTLKDSRDGTTWTIAQ